MGCLEAAELVELFHGSSVGAREQADRHLDVCSACRSLVAAYARAEEDADGDLDPALAATLPVSSVGAEAPRPGDVLGSRWELERVVGEGGMGVVWAARDLATGARAAVKLLKSPSPELCRRFAREARVAAAIGHPNVLEVRAVIPMPDGAPALVMDLLEGRSLAAVLAERGTLPPSELCAVLVPLVGAVRAAHARGVVHRDLKPQNVFLASDAPGAEPVVMLLDFGLAKVVAVDDEAAEKLTRSGAVVGTPHYMAPEQLFGESGVDGRADVWSIGAIAYEALSGNKALEGKTYAQIVRSATRGGPRPLAEVAPGAPAALAQLVDAMLAVERDARPTIAQVHERLDALAAR